MSVQTGESTQPSHILLEGLIKHWDNRKWKQRWAIISKLSPVADCLYVSLYRCCKTKFRSGDPKKVFPLEEYLGIESGFGHENETNTLAVICKKQVFIFSFDTREILAQWKTRLQSHFCREQHFVVQILKTPTASKISEGSARLIVQNFIFCLVSSLPPKLLGYWSLDQLRRFGEIEGKLCFEAGSHCKVPGLYVFYTSQATEIVKCFELASAGQLIQCITHTGSDCDSIFDEKSLVYGPRGGSAHKSCSSDTSSNCESCSNFGSTVHFGEFIPTTGSTILHTSLHNIAQQYHSNNCSTLKKSREICNSNSQTISCTNCRMSQQHHQQHSQQQQQQQQQFPNCTVSLFGTIRNHSNIVQRSLSNHHSESNGIDQHHHHHHGTTIDNNANTVQCNNRSHHCQLPVFTTLPLTGNIGGGNSAGNSSSSPSTTTSSSTDRESIFSQSSSETNDIDHQLHRLEEALLSFETPALNFSHLYSQIDFAARASARASLISAQSSGTVVNNLQASQDHPHKLTEQNSPSLSLYGNYDVPKDVCVHNSCPHGSLSEKSANNVTNNVANNSVTINHCQWSQHSPQHAMCCAEQFKADNKTDRASSTIKDEIPAAAAAAAEVAASSVAIAKQHVHISAVGVISGEMSSISESNILSKEHHSCQKEKAADYENIHFIPYYNLDFTVGKDLQFPPPLSPTSSSKASSSLLSEASTLENLDCNSTSLDRTVSTKESTKLLCTASNWQCDSSQFSIVRIVSNSTDSTDSLLTVENYSSSQNVNSKLNRVNASDSLAQNSKMTDNNIVTTVQSNDKQAEHKCLNAIGPIHLDSKCFGNVDPIVHSSLKTLSRSLVGPSNLPLLYFERKSDRKKRGGGGGGGDGDDDGRGYNDDGTQSKLSCDKISNATICQRSLSEAHLHSLANINDTRQFLKEKNTFSSVQNIQNIDPETRRSHYKSLETLSYSDNFKFRQYK